MHVHIIMTSNLTTCARIKAGWYSISRMYNVHAEKEDFTMSMAYVLINLSQSSGVPSTQIAPKLGMESRSLTRVLKQMENLKIIEKNIAKEDKRVVMVSLTKKGKRLKKRAKAIVLSFNRQVEEEISPERLQIFEEVMGEIIKISEVNLET